MKLKVDKSRYTNLYVVYTYSGIFGWERYDSLGFRKLEDAYKHAELIKKLAS